MAATDTAATDAAVMNTAAKDTAVMHTAAMDSAVERAMGRTVASPPTVIRPRATSPWPT